MTLCEIHALNGNGNTYVFDKIFFEEKKSSTDSFLVYLQSPSQFLEFLITTIVLIQIKVVSKNKTKKMNLVGNQCNPNFFGVTIKKNNSHHSLVILVEQHKQMLR